MVIDRVVLYDRPTSIEQIFAGTLTFSDGSNLDVPELPNNGAALEMSFLEKTVTSVRFQVTNGVGPNVGLSEFRVFGKAEPSAPPPAMPPVSPSPPGGGGGGGGGGSFDLLLLWILGLMALFSLGSALGASRPERVRGR